MKSFIIRIMPSFMVRMFARPYVSGDSIDKGIDKADELWSEKQLSSTLDLLGEEVDTREMVEYNISTYLELIEKIGDREYATVSLKPTSLGIHESYDYCIQNTRRILDAAREKDTPVTIDMEDHTYTDVTLKLYKELLADYPTLGTVLQSRLFRTGKDIEELSEHKGRIRICIGIYNEPKEIALQSKPDMKEKMLEFTKQLIDDGHFVEFATHDEEYINKALEMAEENNWTSDQIEFQQLLGVPRNDIQQHIIEKGYVNRLYVPFATDWKYATPYLKRRLQNNPKMAWYVFTQLIGRIFGKK